MAVEPQTPCFFKFSSRALQSFCWVVATTRPLAFVDLHENLIKRNLYG